MADLTKEERDALSDGDFAVPGKRELPMHDRRHVKLAWDMVDRTKDLTPEERRSARSRILRRAKELGIDTKDWEAEFGEPKPFEIFRVGRHTDMSGKAIDFSAADLAACAGAYDPTLHEAPLVVGHPRTDDPAYGWVKALRTRSGSLFAEPGEVDSAFAELVRAGRFKKLSASFYMPTSPQNPAPGVYYLRHVGFLGAQPPALKGLRPVSFGAGEEGIIEFAGMPGREGTVGRFKAAVLDIVDYAISAIGAGSMDADDPEEDERNSRRQAAGKTEEELQQEDEMTKEELAARQAELDAKEAQFAEREKALKAKESEAMHEANVAFCEKLITEGRMLPANKAAAISVLDFVSAQDGATVEFAEETGTKKLPAADALKAVFSRQPKIVSYGERATGEDDPGADEVKETRRDAELAKYMERNPGASLKDATIEVSRKMPELFDSYQ